MLGKFYEDLAKKTRGAWAVHHGQKTAAVQNAAAEFPALDTAGKAATLLSQLAAHGQEQVSRTKVDALARSAGLNPRLELPPLLELLKTRRLIDQGANGDVEVLGLTTTATVGHAADIFEDLEPTSEERAAIVVAEMASDAPSPIAPLAEFVGDEFELASHQTKDLFSRFEAVGFVDAEGTGADRLYFNGNLFRRDNIKKASRVLSSLSSAETKLITEIEDQLSKRGCLAVSEAKKVLGDQLFDKLMAAGMYDVNTVSNSSGEFAFVTRPAAFHKFNDPLTDDAFDLAKALVAALTFGMTQSSYGRGRIDMIGALLRKLNAGGTIGPATAIGEDYRVLEHKGVLEITKAPSYGHYMRLRKIDIGEMALKVLTTGDTAADVADRPLPGKMEGYVGPEATRTKFRHKLQAPASRKHTFDVLTALRTKGL